jgi:hypothetical protein
VREPCAEEGAEAAAGRAAAPALGELRLVELEQVDELGRRLEGVGYGSTRAEWERREQPRVGLSHQSWAVKGPRAVERRQPSEALFVGGAGVTNRYVLHAPSVVLRGPHDIGHVQRLGGPDPLLAEV